MRILFFVLSLCILFVPDQALAQKRKKRKKANTEAQWEKDFFDNLSTRLSAHVHILANDEMEGRRTGTRGEQMAAHYISTKFSENGITAMGENKSWYQVFEVNEGREFQSGSTLQLNDKHLAAGVDFFPYHNSAAGKVEALVSPVLKEEGMPWFLDLKEELEKNRENPHYDINNYIVQKTTEMQHKKASAVVLYNSSSINDNLKFDPRAHATLISIPVIYIHKTAVNWLKKESEPIDLKLNLALGEKKRKGTNVVGYINNNASSTIIIGAHYDHLGYGEDHNSRYTGKGLQIHNGADDNASGTASLIELSKLLKNKGPVKFNYVFVAFSGEELGLYGSKHFADNPGIDLSGVNYMLNMDMVGRLNDST
ncbi:MAG: M28 family peptidase, partial [Dinghuibacter sp.]|nr:M28 family peptidase [Dinghuibacter sp.]